MTRNFRNALWFFFGFFLVAFPMLSRAETITAPLGYQYYTTNWKYDAMPTWKTDADAACKDASPTSHIAPTGNSCLSSTGQFAFTLSTRCPSGGSFTLADSGYPNGVCRSGSATVPYCVSGQNWTLSGTTCTRPDCSADEVRGSDGLCKPAYKTCASLVVTSTGSCVKSVPCGTASSTPLDTALKTAAVCADQKSDPTNCGAAGGIVIGTFQGKPICLSPPSTDPTCTALGGTVTGTLNGQPICSQANNPPCSGGGTSVGTINGQPVCNGTCPSGSAPGTVNGVSSCYPIAPTTTKTTTQKSTSQTNTTNTSSTDPNVAATTKNTTSTTICEAGACITTTVSNSGTGTPTTTSTTTQDQTDYCKANPKEAVCKGNTDADKFCQDNPDAVSCMKSGTPTEEGGLTSTEKGPNSITPVTIASANGCPSDIALPKGASMSFHPICTYAEGLRPLVLVSAWLLAGLIVLGMSRNT